GDDGFLGGSAHEPGDVGPHGHAGAALELDAVLGHRVDGGAALGGVGAVDHLGVHRGLHRVEDVAASQVDGAGGVPGQVDLGAVRGDEGGDHRRHAPAGQVVRLKLRGGDAEPGFDR